MYGSECSMPGNFIMSAAWSSSSFFVPRTNSCMTCPSLRMDSRMVSPCLTWMRSGVKRMLSLILNSSVRLAALASPAMPQFFCSLRTGPLDTL
ncbi:hypothetical protein D3C71_1805610 [compost metagenome]